MQLHDRFKSIKAARDAITRFILDEGESFHVENSDKKRFTVVCKERCGFRILASKSSTDVVSITRFKPHTCSPAVHYNNPRAHAVFYFIEHYRASIIDNRHITVAQIRSDECLRFCCNVKSAEGSDCHLWNVGIAIYTVKLSPRVSITP